MSNQVGELRTRMIAEAGQMQQAVRETKKDFADLGEQGKKTAKSFTDLSAVLDKVGANTDQLKKIEQAIKDADPAKLEKGLSEVVAELKRMGAESKQIAALEKALQEMGLSADKAEDRVKQLEQKLKELSTESTKAEHSVGGLQTGLTALGAGAATAALARTINSLTDEALALSRAYGGLTEVSKALNVKVTESTALTDKLADRWGLSKAAIADTIKTYLTAGLTLEQVEKIITATADAAVYNRQAHLSWAEAIQQVAQGVKSGNSDLTDAAGITTNLSVMQERYAKSIGTTAGKLTEAQKIQAAYNGIVQESAIFAGNADKAMTGYTGTQASFYQTLQMARAELGEAFIPVLQQIMEKITPMIKGIAEWAAENKELVAGLGAAAVAVGTLITILTTLITVAGMLATAFKALNISMGPIGIAITALSLVATGIMAYKAAADAAAPSLLAFAKSQEELNKRLSESPIKRTTDDVKAMQGDIEKLNALLVKREQMQNRINDIKALGEKGQGTPALLNEALNLGDAIKKIDKDLKSLGYTPQEAAAAITKLKDSMRQAVPALLEMRKAELSDLAAKTELNDRMEELVSKYNKLSQVQKLDQGQKAELVAVVNELKKEYPDLAAEMDKEGVIHVSNIDLISKRIQAEKDLVKTAADSQKEFLKNLRTTTISQIAMVEAQIAQYNRLAVAMKNASQDGDLSSDDLADERAFRRMTPGIGGLSDEQIKLQSMLKEIDKSIAGITSGNYKQFKLESPLAGLDSPTADTTKEKGKTAAEIAAEMRKKAFDDEMSLIRYKAEMYDWDADQQIEAYDKIRDKHKQYLAESLEDEQSLDLLLKSLNEQKSTDAEKAAKAAYDFSAEWIAIEERRLNLKGTSEKEVGTMQLAAWARVRDRYEEDSEFYKRADIEVYNAKMDLIKQAEKAQEQATKDYQKQLDNLKKRTLESIKAAEKTELESLDQRKQAIEDFYDAQLQQLDAADYAKERAEVVADIEKYQFATSREGREKLATLEKRLAELDTSEKKRQLQIEKDAKLRNLDDQRRSVEAYYDSIEAAFSSSAMTIEGIEKTLQDNRLSLLTLTNGKMKAELEKFVTEYNAIMVKMASANLPTSGGTSTSGEAAREQTVKNMMQQNSDDWNKPGTDKAALAAANQELGKSIGATYNSAEGTWYKDGNPLYHSGGIAGEMNFKSDTLLLPDELYAILKRGEVVTTREQIGSLVGAVAGGSKEKPSVTINGPLISHTGDVLLEDDADVRTYWSERDLAAQRLLAEGIRDG